MGRPRLTPEQQEESKRRRKAKQRVAQRARRMQQGEQKTPLEALETFCQFQQQRILAAFHGDPQTYRPRGTFATGPDPADMIEGNTMEVLWGRQRLMRLGPAINPTDWKEKAVVCEIRK